jgi:hypothetical protein
MSVFEDYAALNKVLFCDWRILFKAVNKALCPDKSKLNKIDFISVRVNFVRRCTDMSLGLTG